MDELSRTILLTVHAGAGRGAEFMMPELARFNSESQRFEIRPTIVDPAPRKAEVLAQQAQGIGIRAESIETRLEDFISTDNSNGCPIVVQIDRPASISSAFSQSINLRSPILAYLFIRTHLGTLMGVRIVVQPHEQERKADAALFFEQLALYTVRSGAAHVFGAAGRPEHLATEPLLRQWTAKHVRKNLPKVAVGIEPESPPFEMTTDGATTMQMFMRDNRQGWAEPFDMARSFIDEELPGPVLRGEDFMIAELGPDGVRFHTVRLREIDGKLTVRGRLALDVESVQQALERAERQTSSRVQPIWSTD